MQDPELTPFGEGFDDSSVIPKFGIQTNLENSLESRLSKELCVSICFHLPLIQLSLFGVSSLRCFDSIRGCQHGRMPNLFGDIQRKGIHYEHLWVNFLMMHYWWVGEEPRDASRIAHPSVIEMQSFAMSEVSYCSLRFIKRFDLRWWMRIALYGV